MNTKERQEILKNLEVECSMLDKKCDDMETKFHDAEYMNDLGEIQASMMEDEYYALKTYLRILKVRMFNLEKSLCKNKIEGTKQDNKDNPNKTKKEKAEKLNDEEKKKEKEFLNRVIAAIKGFDDGSDYDIDSFLNGFHGNCRIVFD